MSLLILCSPDSYTRESLLYEKRGIPALFSAPVGMSDISDTASGRIFQEHLFKKEKR